MATKTHTKFHCDGCDSYFKIDPYDDCEDVMCYDIDIYTMDIDSSGAASVTPIMCPHCGDWSNLQPEED